MVTEGLFMKKQMLFAGALVLALVGCAPQNALSKASVSSETAGTTSLASKEGTSSTTASSESASSASSLSSESSVASETSSTEADTPFLTLTADLFPAAVSGGYPDDGTFSKDNVTFHYSSCMQGGGDHSGTGQMKKLTAGLYNTSAISASKVVIDELNTTSAYYTYDAALTLFAGTTENPSENQTEALKSSATIDGKACYHCVYSFSQAFAYFALNNLAGNAVYIVSIAFYA